MSGTGTLALYSGRDRLGSITEGASGCVAEDANGRKLGTFDRRDAALKAIAEHHLKSAREDAKP